MMMITCFELGVSYKEMPYEKLEPYEGKLSRTVLRGGIGSNADLLPDQAVCKDRGTCDKRWLVFAKESSHPSDQWIRTSHHNLFDLKTGNTLANLFLEANPQKKYRYSIKHTARQCSGCDLSPCLI